MTLPRILRTETVHQGWGRFLIATVALADGTEVRREIEDHGDAAVVLPYDPVRRVALLVRQVRAPLLLVGSEARPLEAPAGRLDGDAPEVCARREAEEEVGLAVRDLEPVAFAFGMPGVSTERLHLYLAAYEAGDRTGRGGGLDHEAEQITVEEIALADLAGMAEAGRLPDLKTFCLVQTLRLRRPDLFLS